MESAPQPKDYSQETALAQRVIRIFGYEGLSIEVREGAGWQTQHTGDQIKMIVDPTMLQPKAIKDASGNELPAGTEVPEQYSVYGIAHELGHVDDYIQPEMSFEDEVRLKPSEKFFWNILDDSVINRRLRNIPLLNNLTEEIYRDMLFPKDDYDKLPKHIQFMYGWLLRNVTPSRQATFSPEVTQALNDLAQLKLGKGFRKYDIYRSLSHPDTTFVKRRDIARQYVWPVYEAFLEEDIEGGQQDPDQQNQQNNSSNNSNGGQGGQSSNTQSSDGSSGSSSAGSGSSQGNSGEPGSNGEGSSGQEEQWEEVYEAYADASHCGEHQKDDDEETGAGQGDGEEDHENDPHQAIKEAGKAIRQIQEIGTEAMDPSGSKPEKASGSLPSRQAGEGAGGIAAELQLSPDDAAAYQAVVEQYRTQIHEVARVFQQLTVPSVEYTSPRYRRQSSTDGLKLSPRDLFQVVVAQHSSIDPAVWKPVESITKREGYSFNGLDIHLLVDSSGSMSGVKANSAAACSVILMEGLASARRLVERYSPRAPKPDVRLQVILFGSDARSVVPLNTEVQPRDKGRAFTTVRDAASGSTIVSGALRMTTNTAHKFPQRTQLVYVITDGDFHDRSAALSQVQNPGQNYFLYEYILQSPGTTPITSNASHISRPAELPAALNKQLRVIAAKFLS